MVESYTRKLLATALSDMNRVSREPQTAAFRIFSTSVCKLLDIYAIASGATPHDLSKPLQ